MPGAKRTKAPKPKFEVVKIYSERDIVLQGSWFAPRKGRKNVPGVLLLHDAGSDRSEYDALAAKIQKQGLAVLSVDLRGHGGSKSEKYDWTKLDEKGRNSTWVQSLKDVEAAVKWLLNQDCVHSTRLCMVGNGAGAALAAHHMASEDNAVAVVLLEPPTKAFGFDVQADILDLDGIPTRLVAAKKEGKKDVEAMVSKAREISRDPRIEQILGTPPVLENTTVFRNIARFLDEVANPGKNSRKRGR